MKILIIDDEPRIVEFFSRVANTLGFEDIDTAGSAEEVLAYVARARPMIWSLWTTTCQEHVA